MRTPSQAWSTEIEVVSTRVIAWSSPWSRSQRLNFNCSFSTSGSEARLHRRLLAEHPIEQGLICVLQAVEPCMSFEYHRSPDPAQRGLRLGPRKCLHIYQYYLHPVFGFINARIMRLIVLDPHEEGLMIRDIKEQQLHCGPAALYRDATRVDEMLYAQQEVLGELLRGPVEAFESMMPHELVFTDVMTLVRARTREDFARALRAKSRLGQYLARQQA